MASKSKRPRAGNPEEKASGRGVVVLGLLAPPQIPEEFVGALAVDLPGMLSERVSDQVSWKIPTIRDPRVPDVEGGGETIDDVREWKHREGWDLAVCLTDLPLFSGERVVVADASRQQDAALVSVPALGALRRHRHTREAIVRFVDEVLSKGLELDREDGQHEVGSEHRPDGRLAAIGRIVPSSEGGHLQLVAPAPRGRLQLLAGMVRANRPFRVILGLSYALAASFATGAYVLVTPSIWELGNASGWGRLLALMMLSVTAMVVWLIIVHDLWERPSRSSQEARQRAQASNATTTITLTVGTLSLYAALFTLILLAAGIFVPAGFLQSTVHHPIGFADYVILAWLASSLATVVGALGSGLETSVDVRDAAYSYHRERRDKRDNDSAG